MKQATINLSFEDLWRVNLLFLLKKHFIRVPVLFLTFSLAAFVWSLILLKSPVISVISFVVALLAFYAIMRLTTISRLKRSVSPESMAFSLSLEDNTLKAKWNLTEKAYRKEELAGFSRFLGVWMFVFHSGETITIPARQLSAQQRQTLQHFVGG